MIIYSSFILKLLFGVLLVGSNNKDVRNQEKRVIHIAIFALSIDSHLSTIVLLLSSPLFMLSPPSSSPTKFVILYFELMYAVVIYYSNFDGKGN